jgi:hypothetical protein
MHKTTKNASGSDASTTHDAHLCDEQAMALQSLAKHQVRGCRAAYARMLQGWAQDVLTLRAKGVSSPCWSSRSKAGQAATGHQIHVSTQVKQHRASARGSRRDEAQSDQRAA